MTTCDCTARTSSAASDATFAVRLGSIVSGFYRSWKNRRDFYRLAELSDAELADIGLTRSDLHIATEGPLGTDPTVRLRSLAAGRLDTIEDGARKVA